MMLIFLVILLVGDLGQCSSWLQWSCVTRLMLSVIVSIHHLSILLHIILSTSYTFLWYHHHQCLLHQYYFHVCCGTKEMEMIVTFIALLRHWHLALIIMRTLYRLGHWNLTLLEQQVIVPSWRKKLDTLCVVVCHNCELIVERWPWAVTSTAMLLRPWAPGHISWDLHTCHHCHLNLNTVTHLWSCSHGPVTSWVSRGHSVLRMCGHWSPLETSWAGGNVLLVPGPGVDTGTQVTLRHTVSCWSSGHNTVSHQELSQCGAVIVVPGVVTDHWQCLLHCSCSVAPVLVYSQL